MNTNEIIRQTTEGYERIAGDYSKRWLKDFGSVRYFLDSFIQELQGRNVLDVGCGPGRDVKYLSEVGLEVTGIDLSDSFLEIASKNSPSAKFLKRDMRHLDFPNDSYNGIWACSSFLHIPLSESKMTLEGFYRILKKEGIIYLCVKEGEGERFVEGKDGEKIFFAFYSKNKICDLVQSSGFHILTVTLTQNFANWINLFAKKT